MSVFAEVEQQSGTMYSGGSREQKARAVGQLDIPYSIDMRFTTDTTEVRQLLRM